MKVSNGGFNLGRRRLILSLLLTILIISTGAGASIIGVPGDQATLQDAVDSALDGDTVSLAAGVYSGAGNENVTIFNRALTIIGDPAVDGTLFSLDSSLIGINIEFDFENTADSVVLKNLSFSNCSIAVKIAPVTFNARATVGMTECYFDSNGTAVLKDEFGAKNRGDKNLKSRSDMYDSLRISDCEFTDNSEGLILKGNDNVGIRADLDNCLFTGNELAYEALSSFHSLVFISGSTFDGNASALRGPFHGTGLELTDNGTAVYGRTNFVDTYDEIYLDSCLIEQNNDTLFNTGTILNITNSTITDNPGLFLTGTFANTEAFSTVHFTNCDISGNHAGELIKGQLLFDDIRYIDNRGLYFKLNFSYAGITNSVLAGNDGNAIEFENMSGLLESYFTNALELNGSTIYGNTGSGIVVDSNSYADLIISKSIISENAKFGISVRYGLQIPDITTTCNDIFGNGLGDLDGIPDFIGLDGNIPDDPLFCDPAGADFGLNECSPCASDRNSCGVTIGAYGVTCDNVHCERSWYVGPLGSDLTGDGSSSMPFLTIQFAIDSAWSGDTVVVTAGTYGGAGNVELTTGEKSLVFIGESGPENCLINGGDTANIFNLDGAVESGRTIIEGLGVEEYLIGININAISLDSLSINNCRFLNGGRAVAVHGSPVDMAAVIKIDSCYFQNGIIGINVTADNIESYLYGCTFMSQDTAFVSTTDDTIWSENRIDSSFFVNNTMALAGSFILTRSEIQNGAVGIRGWNSFDGGGTNEQYIDSCLIENVTDTVMRVGNITEIKNSIIRNNPGLTAFAPFGSDAGRLLRVDSCVFGGNARPILASDILELTNSLFVGNDSCLNFQGQNTETANTLSATAFINTLGDVLVSDYGGEVSIQNCSFVNNAGHAVRQFSNIPGTITINDCLIFSNGGNGIITDSPENMTVGCSDLFDNLSGNYSGLSDQTGLNDNISLDPLLCDTSNGEYSYLNISPCLPGNNSCGELIGSFAVGCYRPICDSIEVDSVGSNANVVSDYPVISFCVVDSSEAIQEKFEIAVGSDNDWASAELWNPEVFELADSSVIYDGAALEDGLTYYVRIRVDNGYAWSDWFETVFRMNSLPQIPIAISPLHDTVITTTPTELTVAAANDPEGDDLAYQFRYFNDTQFREPDTIVIDAAADTSVLIAETLNDNWQYHWGIRAYDGFEYSDWSEDNSFWMNILNQAPQPFTIVSPPDTLDYPVYELLPTFAWNLAPDVDPLDTVSYTLVISTDADFDFVNRIEDIAATEYTLPDSLAFGTVYWWKVEAVDGYGLSLVSSNVLNFKTWTLGDVNRSKVADVLDIIYLIDYKYKEGPAPIPIYSGDMNADCYINILDIIELISYKFQTGDIPLPGCTE